MPKYTRPAIETSEFYDASGAAIRYGTRWTGLPPDDSYSRVSNPERFAPLHTIGDALIGHLQSAYRVDVAAPATSSTTKADGYTTTKIISVTPERADAAPLVFDFTDFPGVVIRAGVRYGAAFPPCGCDACDESWPQVADDMERLVFAVTNGRFSERITLPTQKDQMHGKALLTYRIETVGGQISMGRSYAEPESALRDGAERLEGLPDGCWQAWISVVDPGQ